MKSKFAPLLAALALIAATPAQAVDMPQHHHPETGQQTLQLNGDKKWETDVPLRLAMTSINEAMAKAVPLIHENQFNEEAYQTLAGTISKNVAYAIANCKLVPTADATLHVIIGDLMTGAELMGEKTPDARHDGAVQVLRGLKAYGDYFQHPGW